MRGRPGPRSAPALDDLITHLIADRTVTEPAGTGPFSTVVDVALGAQRLAGWALWVELAAIARLIAAWREEPPVLYSRLAADPCEEADPGLADRLQRLLTDLELGCLPDSAPVDTAEFAEEFVISEMAPAMGLSFQRTRQHVGAAVALFLTDRLPRTAALLRAGLLDWIKLQTLLKGTAALDDETCRVVEARVISDADLQVADPLDVRADPARPGAPLPAVTKMTNPAVERALAAAVLAVDAEGAERRAREARERRAVRASPLPDGMGRLEVEAGQEIVAAILGDLGSQVASAKAAGDARRPDQIRCDELVHRMTFGAFGRPATAAPTPAGPGRPGEPDESGPLTGPGEPGEPAGSRQRESGAADPETDSDHHRGSCPSCGRPESAGERAPRYGRWGRRGLHVGLTMPLSTWLGLTEEPGLLEGYGPIAAGLARQIAAEAARDHPLTTSWRCVVVGDQHRTVLGVGDLIPTPRHDPPPRLARLVTTADPWCVYPNCPAPAWRCDLDHRKPFEQGGSTCSCNLQPLCRRHHRLKGASLVSVRAVTPAPDEDPDAPPGTVEWTTWTGRTYRHQPPELAVAPVRPTDLARAAAVEADRVQYENLLDHSKVMDENYDEDWAVRDWHRSLRRLHERPPRPAGDPSRTSGSPPRVSAPRDEPPPF